nr:MAG TPA: hypothetical protein [Bacteriophage sp.]
MGVFGLSYTHQYLFDSLFQSFLYQFITKC